MATAVVSALLSVASAPVAELPRLPARVRRIVLHTLGGPFYGQPEMRWVFYSPEETLRRWKRPSFGAHWIVATDGAIWPRHPVAGEPPFFLPSTVIVPPAAATVCSLITQCEPRSPPQLSLHESPRSSLPRSSRPPR